MNLIDIGSVLPSTAVIATGVLFHNRVQGFATVQGSAHNMFDPICSIQFSPSSPSGPNDGLDVTMLNTKPGIMIKRVQ